jgi:hypothetical protein
VLNELTAAKVAQIPVSRIFQTSFTFTIYQGSIIGQNGLHGHERDTDIPFILDSVDILDIDIILGITNNHITLSTPSRTYGYCSHHEHPGHHCHHGHHCHYITLIIDIRVMDRHHGHREHPERCGHHCGYRLFIFSSVSDLEPDVKCWIRSI